MKKRVEWFSERLRQDVQVVRWGELGTPVLLFPTAGGDAEEIERFHIITVLSDLLEQGRIKIYSCDSVAGRTWMTEEGSLEHRAHIQNMFHEFVAREVVPAIREDCQNDEIETIAAGASIGAYNALSVLCRYPEFFSHAVCLSGTFDLAKVIEAKLTEDLYEASPIHFVPNIEGERLAKLQTRFALFASGEGRAEDIGESWRAAHILGSQRIPNRVDSWGIDWDHDWPTWRHMLPQYLSEFTKENSSD